MKCPVCVETQLVLAERSGIEIDYCPNCRGVWLDRGELDKMIERSAAAPASQPSSQGHRQDFVDSDFDQHGRRRKKSWLRDIFD